MGKRSDFTRVERDYYPTPRAALIPLLPHLGKRSHFVEPCAGDGRLVRNLEAEGHICLDAFDIEPQHKDVRQADALNQDGRHLVPCSMITNPPWSRNFLHQLIERWRVQMPTWLLFDADWAHTQQAAPFLPYCHKIVAVGRIKWIEGSNHTGKDNCCWHLFGNIPAPTVFYGRP